MWLLHSQRVCNLGTGAYGFIEHLHQQQWRKLYCLTCIVVGTVWSWTCHSQSLLLHLYWKGWLTHKMITFLIVSELEQLEGGGKWRDVPYLGVQIHSDPPLTRSSGVKVERPYPWELTFCFLVMMSHITPQSRQWFISSLLALWGAIQ